MTLYIWLVLSATHFSNTAKGIINCANAVKEWPNLDLFLSDQVLSSGLLMK